MKWFKEDSFYLYIKEGKMGLNTFIEPNTAMLPGPYRRVIIAFLEDVIETLRDVDAEEEGPPKHPGGK